MRGNEPPLVATIGLTGLRTCLGNNKSLSKEAAATSRSERLMTR